MSEQVSALFFDADGDRDPDLFVGSGGNRTDLPLENHLYLNDGNGNFTASPNALENTGMNTCCAIAHDFDADGDEDLFVASRSVPLNYGSTPVNAFYVNNGTGKFTNTARTLNKNIARTGMITGLELADLNVDGKKDLVMVGEWMAPVVFNFTNGHFEELNTNLSGLTGWWRAVKSADIDNDGDADLVLGNIGENFYLQPDSSHPVKLFINDFEKKGAIDKIITHTEDGKDKPVFLKRDFTEQLATLRKQNLKHRDFANKSVNELFKEEDIKGAVQKKFEYASSCVAINDGTGKFAIRKLPVNVQLSSVNAILPTDVNNDGLIDLILGGNEFNLLPQFCRLDASFGHVLLNKGRNTFDWTYPDKSGLEIRGQVRDMVEIKDGNKRMIVVLQNNTNPVVYEMTPQVGKK
jgi:hypothetical protein